MKYIVYQTINLVNNKIYIGVHKTKDPTKFDGYIGCGVNITQSSTYMNPHTPFQCAVKKYGGKMFKRSTLYIYDELQQALNKEKQLVDKDFITNPNTYNVSIGGSGYPQIHKPIYQFSCDGKLIKKWDFTEDVINFFNVSPYAIETALQFKEKLVGYFWSRKNSINIEEYSKGDNKIVVYKYTKEGKCIAIYPSIRKAAEVEHIERTVLTTDIKLQSLVNNQFYFSDKLYDEFKPKLKKSLRNSIFYLYNLSGQFITKFNSSKDLMKYLNTTHWNTIYRAIHAQKGIYKNYYISTIDLGEHIDKKTNKSASKQVDVYKEDGSFIKTCDSVQKATHEFNAKLSSVNRVLRGLAHTANHYVFKWHE